jgi:hypothetical protein
VLVAVVFAGLFFAAPDFSIHLNGLGIQQEVTLLQVSAVAPLVIAYLILHACYLGGHQLRLSEECRVIDTELRKFGCETSYSTLERFRADLEKNPTRMHVLLSRVAYHVTYLARDGFIVTSTIFAFVGAAYVALTAYESVRRGHPHAAIGFYIYLGIAILGAMIAPIVLWHARRTKKKALDVYLSIGPQSGS